MNSDGLPIHNNKILVGSATGIAAYADSLPIPTGEPNNRTGWYFEKTAGAEKFNYYFYTQGSHPVELKHIDSLFFVGAIDNYVNGSSVPFLVVYTKPLGDGQDAAFWYRSKIAYTIGNASGHIHLGEKTQFSTVSQPNPRFPYTHVHLNNIVKTGLGNPDEEILTMAVHSDSAAAITTKILISHVGWRHTDANHSSCILLKA